MWNEENEMEKISNDVFRIENERIIYINGPVTDAMSLEFNMMLLSMEAESPNEDISIYINTRRSS